MNQDKPPRRLPSVLAYEPRRRHAPASWSTGVQLLLALAPAYLGLLIVLEWSSVAIGHYQDIEGKHELYGLPNSEVYEKWAYDIPALAGALYVIVAGLVSTSWLAINGATARRCLASILGHVGALIALMWLLCRITDPLYE